MEKGRYRGPVLAGQPAIPASNFQLDQAGALGFLRDSPEYSVAHVGELQRHYFFAAQ